jgi:hypothetical protein
MQGGPIAWYRIVVPTNNQLSVTASLSMGAGLVRLYESCSTSVCLSQSAGGVPSTLRWTNNRGGPVSVLVAVSSAFTSRSDSGSVSFALTAAPTNSTCARAQVLRADELVRTEDPSRGGEVPRACTTESAMPLGALWYRITVPPMTGLSVAASTVAPTRGTATVRIMTACAGACEAVATSQDARTTLARWVNASAGAREVFVAVSPTFPAIGEPLDLIARFVPVPTNVTCARATTVMNGTVLTNEDPSFATVLQPPCPGMPGTLRPVLFYRATVPPGQTLVATATPVVPRGAPVLQVIPDCASVLCFAASASAGTIATVVHTNTGATSQSVVIPVGYTSAALNSPYNLSVSIRPPAVNASCASATRVMNGTMLPGESLSDARDRPTACPTPGRDGPVLYYAVRVGAGEQLTAVATRVDGLFSQPILRLTNGCMSSMCIASSATMPSPGTNGRLSYVNTSGAAQELILMLGQGDAAAPATGRVSLAITVARPPYTVSMVPAACDTLTSSTLFAEAVGDDRGTSSIPLPLPFPYFGAPMNGLSVSTNGYLQLWPMGGMSSGALGSFELPNASAPSNMVSAFWDDLEISPGADVRWQVFPIGTPHFTVQWTNANFCCGGGSPDRVTFQIKLFLGGAIEMHYCRLDGSARVFGSNASIGIQNATGTLGVSYAVRRANAINTTTAIRFAP